MVGIWTILLVSTLAPAASERMLLLRAGTMDTALLADARSARGPMEAGKRYVLHLDGPMTPGRRAVLEDHGVRIGAYLPKHAYLVLLAGADAEALASLDFIAWIGEYRREWKIDPAMGRRDFATPERQTMRDAGRCALMIHLFEDADDAVVLQTMRDRGLEIHDVARLGPRSVVHAFAALDSVAGLADIDAVQFIEEAPELVPRNDTNEWIAQSNVEGETPVWDQGIHGEGQIGGLIDWPPNIEHCVFADEGVPIGPNHRKFVAYRSAPGTDSHGTHVCGTYVGDSGTPGVHDFRDGIAFAAKVSYSSAPDISLNPTTLFARLEDAQNDGAFVHSNSWGDDSTTEYTTWSEQADRFSRENEESLVVFAVTNQFLLKTPENAKNILAVGATSDTPNQGNHCMGGAGPTSDGRRKPEIFAPGCTTFSAGAFTECGFVSFNGTSYATPVVAGCGLLTRQYFMEGFYPSGQAAPTDALTPSGALLKAMLLNATVDMDGEAGYPSDQEGWGRLLLDNVLYFNGDSRSLMIADVRNAAGLSTADSMSFDFDLAADVEPLRITLVWTDVPATVGAASAPINDLDLVVTSPDGATFRGNNFANGQTVAGGAADDINNVEQVLRTTPRIGSYTVTVEGTAVDVDTQGFALVITGDLSTAGAPGDMECPADVNGDGTIDGLDAVAVQTGFCANAPCDDALDANGDGVVNPLDLGYVLARLGDCP